VEDWAGVTCAVQRRAGGREQPVLPGVDFPVAGQGMRSGGVDLDQGVDKQRSWRGHQGVELELLRHVEPRLWCSTEARLGEIAGRVEDHLFHPVGVRREVGRRQEGAVGVTDRSG